MRNPSLILAAALFAAATASAAGDGWRNVRFKDEAGVEHSLWCKTSECGPGTKGSATLYAFDNEKSVTSTTEEGYLWWKKTTSATQKTFDAKVSSYSLDLASNKAVAGTKSFPVENQAALPAQVTMTVAVSQAAADDLPTALTPAEKYWLADTERKEYDRQAAQPMKPEARQKLQAMTRNSMVVKHLPSFAQAQYKKLTTGTFDPVKVSVYLDGLVSIKDPADLKKLESIQKGKGAGARLQRENGLLEYQTQMSTVKMGPDGRPDPRFRDIAVKKVAEFRGMLRAGAGTGPGHKPGDKPDHAPAGVVLDLTASERDWLTNEQRSAYEEAIAGKPAKDALLKLDKDARDNVKANLRETGRAGYEAALAEMTPAAINAALLKVPHYSGAETDLLPAELEQLAKITKKENADVRGATAKEDYTGEMRLVRKNGDAYVKSEHLHARAIAVKYRDILAKAKMPPVPGTPAQPKPGDQPEQPGQKPPKPRKLKVSDEDLAYLTAKDRADYQAQWDEASKQPAGQKRDDALADIAAKYQAMADEIKAMKPPVTSQDFAGLTDNQKNKFCETLGSTGGATSAETKAMPQLKTAAGSTDNTDATVDGNTGRGSAAGPAPGAPLTPEQKKHEAELRAQCREYAQNQAAKNPKPNVGGAGAVPSPTSKDCGKPKNKDGSKVDPSLQAGTDKDTSCPEEQTFDQKHPAFYKNLANGVTMGMFGLIVGSFFGGPLVMAGAALVMGAGAFALSAHFNPPPKKKDGDGA